MCWKASDVEKKQGTGYIWRMLTTSLLHMFVYKSTSLSFVKRLFKYNILSQILTVMRDKYGNSKE